MSFYLSNTTAQPTGVEPGEFLDIPSMAEVTVRFEDHEGDASNLRFRPFFGSGPRAAPGHHEGFLRVRVSDDVKPTGYVVVYLATGTAITVATDQVLLLGAGDP